MRISDWSSDVALPISASVRQRGVALGEAERWPVSIWALQRFQPTTGHSRTIMSRIARRWSMLAAVCGSHERTSDSMLFSGLSRSVEIRVGKGCVIGEDLGGRRVITTKKKIIDKYI